MDAAKKTQVINVIATEVSKLPANTPMDHGTVGSLTGQTKRESSAEDTARFVVSKIEKVTFSGSLYETWTDAEKAANDLVKEIAHAVIEITGK